MIPEAAVEAAAKALNIWLSEPYNAADIAELHPEISVILEAAAPHMLADAWEAGHFAVVNDAFRDKLLRKRGSELKDPTPNPFRPTP